MEFWDFLRASKFLCIKSIKCSPSWIPLAFEGSFIACLGSLRMFNLHATIFALPLLLSQVTPSFGAGLPRGGGARGEESGGTIEALLRFPNLTSSPGLHGRQAGTCAVGYLACSDGNVLSLNITAHIITNISHFSREWLLPVRKVLWCLVRKTRLLHDWKNMCCK